MRPSSPRLLPRYLSTGTKSEQEKNFGLTKTEFETLRADLQNGDQRLYERIFLQHFDDARKYLCRNDGATASAAYDAVMETMLGFRDLLAANKINYGNLRYLFTRMARQEFARTGKRGARYSDLPPEFTEIPEEDIVFLPEDYELLKRAFKMLGPACRELLRSFYFDRQTLKDIAQDQERGAPAVRKQKSRCVATLRHYFYRIS